MTKYIEKSKAEGRIDAPTSKSVAHRLLILGAMCEGEKSVIRGITPSDDVLATIDCLSALGVKIEYDGWAAVVDGIDFSRASATDPLLCRESGSTLRFLIPMCLISGNEATLVGSEKLISRPQGVYEKIAEENGFLFKRECDRITLRGRLLPGEYSVVGDVSSQFITGLILALSTLKGESKILFTTKIESRSYIELTRSALMKFGGEVRWDGDSALIINGGKKLCGVDMTVEGDWSGTSFIEALGLVGGEVKVDGLDEGSLQGDRVYREHFRELDKGFCEIDISDCPDLGPILFTVAALKHGGRFVGTRRLKIKESDRCEAMKEELEKFGAEILIEENALTVLGADLHAPNTRLKGHNDHRIVMSLAVLCSVYGGEIEGCEAVKKSYPAFFRDINRLGIKAYDID